MEDPDSEISHQFKATSLAHISPSATHLACLNGNRLQIRSITTLELIRSISLPSDTNLRASLLRWSPPIANRSNRILLSDEDNARIWDLRDEKWGAVINNGSGGMGKIVHAEWGRNEEEALLWNDFCSKVTVWCLRTGRSIEIRDPKFGGKDKRGYGYRPNSEEGKPKGMLALLCRPAGQDTLMLLAPKTYAVVRQVVLETTDAQGIRWSPDGRWLVVWDSAGSGYRVLIYTADGHLYRMYTGDRERDNGVEGLGVKSVEWSSTGDYLAIGGWDRRVTLLSTRTFSPVVFLDHTPSIELPDVPVYTETVPASGQRSYTLSPQPVSPPTAATTLKDPTPKQGISLISFNLDGTLVATRDDSCPTTIWLWDLRLLSPKTIIIQHAPIRSLQWQPKSPNLLLIQCIHDEPIFYIWTHSPELTSEPHIFNLSTNLTKPAGSLPIKWDAKWLPTASDKRPGLVCGHQQGHVLVWPEGRDPILKFEHDDGGTESEDSLYDILTGRTPVPVVEDTTVFDEGSTASFEDTFREKRARKESEVFDESGMSEMF